MKSQYQNKNNMIKGSQLFIKNIHRQLELLILCNHDLLNIF